MMDRYSSRLPLVLAPKGETRWAVTLGQTTWYSVPSSEVDAAWRRHEECHKRQYARDGVLRFLLRYIWEYLRGRLRGLTATEAYRQISYEVEARKAEEKNGGQWVRLSV